MLHKLLPFELVASGIVGIVIFQWDKAAYVIEGGNHNYPLISTEQAPS